MEKKRPSSTLGKLAEDYAVKFLKGKGYRIVDRNFRGKFGEIDIVAIKDKMLIFIEVKARWSLKFGSPEEAVTPSKLWKIQKTAEYYSSLHASYPNSLRIEVVALEISGGSVTSSKIIPVY